MQLYSSVLVFGERPTAKSTTNHGEAQTADKARDNYRKWSESKDASRGWTGG